MPGKKKQHAEYVFPKCPTGIQGLDEVTKGGLPRGRPTLVCGSAGSGKTLLGMEFLVRGALQYDEPGVCMSFEETAQELAQNIFSLGWDLDDLVRQKKIVVDHVQLERSEIEEAGVYDLEGLFIRLQDSIDSIGAKRVVIDTAEVLFGAFTNETIMRAEFHRLCRWLKDKGVSAIITGEPGEKTLTRYGMEEYVSDCVITLDHRITEQLATRRMRIVKYRGTIHGTNEYPFLIGETGISVMPITSIGLDYEVTTGRIPSGIKRLDTMLGGKGYYRGSSILVSGTAGTGKSSLAASFINAACQRGERSIYFSFEESPAQIMRNMRSIGINLEPWVQGGLLEMHSMRATLYGLETHLAVIHKLIEDSKPQVVVVDPISNLATTTSPEEVKSMLTRIIDYLKMNRVTSLFTDLSHVSTGLETTESEISSLMDTWILLRDIESGGERNRGIYVLKSRGMAHSNQIREFLLTDKGIDLLNVYLGPAGVLTGTARISKEAEEQETAHLLQEEIELKQREIERKRKIMEAQIASLRADFEAEEQGLNMVLAQAELKRKTISNGRDKMSKMRTADKK